MPENYKIIDKDCIVITDTNTHITRALWGNLAVLTFTPAWVTLNVKGETTTVMRNKLHRVAQELGLVFCLVNSRGAWLIDTPFEGLLPYYDSITFSRLPLTNEE